MSHCWFQISSWVNFMYSSSKQFLRSWETHRTVHNVQCGHGKSHSVAAWVGKQGWGQSKDCSQYDFVSTVRWFNLKKRTGIAKLSRGGSYPNFECFCAHKLQQHKNRLCNCVNYKHHQLPPWLLHYNSILILCCRLQWHQLYRLWRTMRGLRQCDQKRRWLSCYKREPARTKKDGADGKANLRTSKEKTVVQIQQKTGNYEFLKGAKPPNKMLLLSQSSDEHPRKHCCNFVDKVLP